MVSVATQWGFFLPAAYVVGVVLGHGLMGVWLVQVTYRAASAAVMAVLWRRGSWASIDV